MIHNAMNVTSCLRKIIEKDNEVPNSQEVVSYSQALDRGSHEGIG
jgi:hypothetical protein